MKRTSVALYYKGNNAGKSVLTSGCAKVLCMCVCQSPWQEICPEGGRVGIKVLCLSKVGQKARVN